MMQQQQKIESINKLTQHYNNPSSIRINSLQSSLFNLLGITNYKRNEIKINEQETIYSVFIESKSQISKVSEVIYLGHGFASTSLFYFPIINKLLLKYNVVLWEIRGMGLCQKADNYNQYQTQQQIEEYFLQGITYLLKFYKHQKIIMVCHSFSAYLILLYTISFNNHNIHKLLLLSPVGITPKQNDYKNTIKSCSDIGQTILSKIGWKFKLTYKSPLRTICSCLKGYLVQKSIEDLQMTDNQKNLIKQIILTLITLKDGSEDIFFELFQPRVLPKKPIQNIFKQHNIKIDIFFGGQTDWADRLGAYQLAKLYSQCIKVFELQNCGHNIPFNIKCMNQVINNLFEN